MMSQDKSETFHFLAATEFAVLFPIPQDKIFYEQRWQSDG